MSDTPLQQRSIWLAALPGSGAFDFRGIRQISMKAWMPGSLPAEIKKICRSGNEAVKKVLIDLRICREMNEDAARAGIRPNAQR
ncbi:hypothetical protein [Eisenbergiella massiliensis]|uniref:hypothetical protein n=1 Tax=Eisenbergiella massiliensis TaxID=1720294 RepID=UPI0018A6C0EE|nr:hypothetical protein [Eisenbergiella massiliensis]